VNLVEIVLAVISSTAVTALITQWYQRRKTTAETDHTVVDTATDAIAMVKGAHGERIAMLENAVVSLKHQSETDRAEIISLSRRLGEIRMAAELQSRNILLLTDEVQLWRSRVSELLIVLRERSLPLPAWAEKT